MGDYERPDYQQAAEFMTARAESFSNCRDTMRDLEDWWVNFMNPVGAPDLPGDWLEPERYDSGDFRPYIRELYRLKDEFEVFNDGDPNAMDGIVDKLSEAMDLVRSAVDYGGLAGVHDRLMGGNWTGGAAESFELRVLNNLATVMGNQGLLIGELIAAAVAFKDIVSQGKMDAIGIIDQLNIALVPPDSGGISGADRDLDFYLKVVGIAVGAITVATNPGGLALTSWAASSTLTLNSLRDAPGTASEVQVSIDGAHMNPDSFFESTRDEIEKLKAGITGEYSWVTQALHMDKLEVAASGRGHLYPTDSDLHDLQDADDLWRNDNGEASVDNISDLWVAGDILLPATAAFLDSAYKKVGDAADNIETAFGEFWYPGPSFRFLLEDVRECLASTRDNLADAGEKLVFAARTYFENEEETRQVLDSLHESFDQITDPESGGDAYPPHGMYYNRVDPRGGLDDASPPSSPRNPPLS